MNKLIAMTLVAALMPICALAAGQIGVTETKTMNYSLSGGTKNVRKITVDWLADASDASVPNLTLPLEGFLVRTITDPGHSVFGASALAPTDNYDIALIDPDKNIDALATTLNNRDEANIEQVINTSPYLFKGNYTLQITNNSVNSADGQIIFYLIDQR